MLRLAIAVLAAATVPAAHAQQTQPAAIQPGTYDLDVTFGGGLMTATLHVTTTGDSLAVTLHVADHASPVRAGQRQGNRLVLESTVPGMDVRYELEFQRRDRHRNVPL